MTVAHLIAAAPGHHQFKPSEDPVCGESSFEITVCLAGDRWRDLETQALRLAKQAIGTRRHLSHADLCEQYSADRGTSRRISEWLKSLGLEIVDRDPAGWWISARGTASAFEDGFGITLEHFDGPLGTVRGHHEHPSIPAALADQVRAVLGLDSVGVAQPQAGVHASHVTRHTNPAEVAAAYRFPDSTGAGQRIGVISLGGGFHEADLEAFFKNHGMPVPTIAVHPVAGAANQPAPAGAIAAILEAAGATADHHGIGHLAGGSEAHVSAADIAWTVETTMDLELVGALAPGAEIHLYLAPNTTRGKYHAIRAAIDDGMHVVSMSWSGHEHDKSRTYLDVMESLFTLAAARGVTVCCSSGDDGRVGYPSSSPWVLAVGGTHLHIREHGGVWESAWNEALPTPRCRRMCSGGGVSKIFGPPEWQSSARIPEKTGMSGRGVPDVAAKADIATGYPIVAGGVVLGGGGTSAATPLWAALVARCTAGRPDGDGSGFLNSQLYGDTRACRPVDRGNVGQFSAGPGWDPCTGLGSPRGEDLLRLIAQPEDG